MGAVMVNIYEYLMQFLIQNSWDCEYTQKQARALWTSYCLVTNIDVDTRNYDNDLLYLYDKAALDEMIAYNDFDDYMSELLI